MRKIEDYAEKNEKNDQVLQKALRELDLDTVIHLCAKLKNKAEIIYRNLSKRVFSEITDYLKKYDNTIDKNKKNNAYAKFQKILLKIEDNKKKLENIEYPDKLKFNSTEQVKQSLYFIQYLNQKNEVEKLFNLIQSIENSDYKKLFKCILYNFDPLKAEILIDKISKKLLSQYKKRLELIKHGIISVLSDDSMEELFEILNV